MDAHIMTPTDEQVAILDFVRNTSQNLMINAYAGTGKSTTLEMIDATLRTAPTLYIVFNKDAKTKAEKAQKDEKRWRSTTAIKTFNGLGHGVWMKTVGTVTLDTKKTSSLVKEAMTDLKGEDRDCYWEVVSGVNLAKALGYVPASKYPAAKRLITPEAFHAALEDRPSPLVRELIDDTLILSIKAAYKGLIDFNDQIYMPTLFGGTFPRFPNVLVDEAQDLNPVNHEMLRKLGRGWVCAVGDPWQSIYAFRGAVRSGMDSIRSHFQMCSYPISISFRCPQAIVEAARWRVPEFQWVKPGGRYEILSSLHYGDIPDGATILCRNNAPLLRMAFHLLAQRRGVTVAGSDIGPKVTRLLSKLGHEDTCRSDLLDEIALWEEARLATSQSPGSVHDLAACMRIFAGFGETLGQALAYADYLFKSTGTIKLMTGHKAKGAEWDHVYFLNPYLCAAEEQDMNLRYVIQTRSANYLGEIDDDRITWN